MADNEKHVVRGDPARITAETWNSILDVVAWFRRHKGTIGANGVTDLLQSNLEAFVRNDSGIDLTTSYRVLNLYTPLLDIANNTRANTVRHSFKGDTPVSDGDFIGIVQTPLATTKISRVVFKGLTVARVKINDDSHSWCKSVAGEVEYLESSESGVARIISTWDEGSGSGSGGSVGSGSGPPVMMALIDLIQTNINDTGSGGGNTSSSISSWLDRGECLDASISNGAGRCEAVENQTSDLAYDEDTEGWISSTPITTDTGDWTLYFFAPDIDHPVPWAFLINDDESEYVDLEFIGFAGGKAQFSGMGDVLCAGTYDPACERNSFHVAIGCKCCPVSGWGGAGYYVVGTSGCSVLHTKTCQYLATECAATGKLLCSGPHETIEDCALANESPSTVVKCGKTISTVLYLTWPIGGNQTFCHLLDFLAGESIPLVYDAGTETWKSDPIDVPSCDDDLEIELKYSTTGCQWTLFSYGAFKMIGTGTGTGLLMTEDSDSPLVVYNANGGNTADPTACCTSFAISSATLNSDNFVITE